MDDIVILQIFCSMLIITWRLLPHLQEFEQFYNSNVAGLGKLLSSKIFGSTVTVTVLEFCLQPYSSLSAEHFSVACFVISAL